MSQSQQQAESASESPVRKSRKKNFFQISLRLLLVVFMGACAFIGYKIESVNRQWKIADEMIPEEVTLQTEPSIIPQWLAARIFPEGRSQNICSADVDLQSLSTTTLNALGRLAHLKEISVGGGFGPEMKVTKAEVLDAILKMPKLETVSYEIDSDLLADHLLKLVEKPKIQNVTVSSFDTRIWTIYDDLRQHVDLVVYDACFLVRSDEVPRFIELIKNPKDRITTTSVANVRFLALEDATARDIASCVELIESISTPTIKVWPENFYISLAPDLATADLLPLSVYPNHLKIFPSEHHFERFVQDDIRGSKELGWPYCDGSAQAAVDPGLVKIVFEVWGSQAISSSFIQYPISDGSVVKQCASLTLLTKENPWPNPPQRISISGDWSQVNPQSWQDVAQAPNVTVARFGYRISYGENQHAYRGFSTAMMHQLKTVPNVEIVHLQPTSLVESDAIQLVSDCKKLTTFQLGINGIPENARPTGLLQADTQPDKRDVFALAGLPENAFDLLSRNENLEWVYIEQSGEIWLNDEQGSHSLKKIEESASKLILDWFHRSQQE